jgi:hypothetical protein
LEVPEQVDRIDRSDVFKNGEHEAVVSFGIGEGIERHGTPSSLALKPRGRASAFHAKRYVSATAVSRPQQ